ncbi:MAG: 30S ribosomal protein S5 [Candidatus Kerfeldbacteria bacterium]|nr:30S ribosomal protein S5 [Candidatus Kerfeldbacteria bacterium]
MAERSAFRGRRRSRRGVGPREPKEFEQKTIDLARVTRVVAGGKRMRFRATVALGDLKGRVGVGIAKGADVSIAIQKASRAARKNLLRIPVVGDTIPHQVVAQFGAAKVLLKPASPGTGVIAGGPIRVVMELAGIKNVVSKILGSPNTINNLYALLRALSRLRTKEELLRQRGRRP